MMIVSYVCADFYDKNCNLIHRITREDLGDFNYPPDSIKEDPLFQMLVDDGSIRFVEDNKTQKALESNPYAGISAEGREVRPKEETKPKRQTRAKAAGKTEAKDEEESAEKAAETEIE